MTDRNVPILAAAICCAALAGCSAAPGPSATEDSTKFTVENTERFAALDPAAEAAVTCTGLQERMLGDGRLEVVANVKNRGGEPVKVRVQCLFLDDQGEATKPPHRGRCLRSRGMPPRPSGSRRQTPQRRGTRSGPGARPDYLAGVGWAGNVTFFSASSIALTPASSAALSAALLATTGEPFEKSMVLPSCIGTGAAAGRPPERCDTYAHRSAAVAEAATRAEAVRRGFIRHTIVHRGPVRNNARA